MIPRLSKSPPPCFLPSDGTDGLWRYSFLKCFKRIFQPSALSALISFINTQVPIRRWIPLEANLGYLRATKEVRRLLLECVRQRIVDIDRANEKNETFAAVELPGSGRDLLTIMVQERWRVNKMEGDVLNEEDIVNQVGGTPMTRDVEGLT